MVEVIYREGKPYPAARCPRCGLLVNPPENLELHEDLHTTKDLLQQPALNHIRRYLKRMRDL